MEEYVVKVKFSDGSTVFVDVEANDEGEALDKAMPVELDIYK